jgi:uncharacterized protein
MAITLYVASTRRVSGKTALCVGLMHWFQQLGFSPGYMKPVSTTARAINDIIVDEDSRFVKSTFNLPDAAAVITPIHLTEQATKEAIERPNQNETTKRIVTAFTSVTRDRDVVVLEGTDTLRQGSIIDLSTPQMCKLTGAKAVVIVQFLEVLQVVDDLLVAQSWIGEPLLGALINNVPQHRMSYFEEKVKPFLENKGLNIIGIIPQKRALQSVSIAELVDQLSGEVLCCEAASDELVEAVMVGAMSAESALTHFRRVANKAVITGGDRPDIQLVALETSTKCLILTGNLRPSPLVVGLAEERGVPIIVTRHDTIGAIEIVDSYFGKSRFGQQKKIETFEGLLNKHFNFDALQKSLGIEKK